MQFKVNDFKAFWITVVGDVAMLHGVISSK